MRRPRSRGPPGEPAGPAGRRITPRGQAVHLPLHAGRAVAHRHFRPQAPARPRQRQAGALREAEADADRRPATCWPRPGSSRKHGEAGIEVSELFPHVAACVDDLCVIRSMVADNINHTGACLQMNTGEQAFSRPEPGLVAALRPGQREPEPARLRRRSARRQPARAPRCGARASCRPPTRGPGSRDLKNPIANLKNRSVDPARQREQLDAARGSSTSCTSAAASMDSRLGRPDRLVRAGLPDAGARPRGLRRSTGETAATRKLYGIDDPATDTFGQQCLLARRLVERGVPVRAGLPHGTAASCQLWDQHGEPQGERCRTAARRPTGRSPACSRT